MSDWEIPEQDQRIDRARETIMRQIKVITKLKTQNKALREDTIDRCIDELKRVGPRFFNGYKTEIGNAIERLQALKGES